MYKVFFNNNKLILSNNKLTDIAPDLTHLFTKGKKLRKFIFEDCSQVENKTVCIQCDDIDQLWTKFKGLFKIKTAGGGVVVNSKNQVLFIKRRGLWDLPKGHQEKGEEITHTALREVEEECSIDSLTITKPIKTSYHTYWLKGKAILKPTFWFLMNYSGNNSGKPQLEEEITEIKWFALKDLNIPLQNTFPSIIDTINACFADHEL